MRSLLVYLVCVFLAGGDPLEKRARHGNEENQASGGGCTLTIANTSLIDFWDFEDSANMGLSSAGQLTDLQEFNMAGTQTTTGALTGSNAFDVASNSEVRLSNYSTTSGWNANTDSTDWSKCVHAHAEASPTASLDHVISNAQRGEIFANSGDDDLRMHYGSTGSINQEIVVTAFSATDEWFMCVTVDGVAAADDVINYYVNGVASSGSPHGGEWAEEDNFVIGADRFGNGNGDSFIVDSVSTFNATLSAAQVAELGGACGGKVSDA